MAEEGKGFWFGFFLVSLVVLYLEILVTRVLSLVLWHNLAYLVISLAMLGIGAAGVWHSLFPAKSDKLNLARLSLLASVSLFFVCRFMGVFDFGWDWKKLVLVLVFSSLLIFIPFFFMGLALVRVFAAQASRIGTVYGVNLAASGAGVILGLALLKPLGMPNALMLACILLGLSAFFFRGNRFAKVITFLWVILCLTGLWWSGLWFKFNVSSTKSMGRFKKVWPDFHLDFSKWDPMGRVDAFGSSRALLKFEDESIPYRGLTIDGAADTTLIGFKEKLKTTRFFRGSVYGQSFVLHSGPLEKVLAIGVGGAPDVEAGMFFNAPSVIGVDVNGSVLEAVRKFLPEVAHDPHVTLVHSDGRSFVAQSRDKYSIIQISGVDTISALQWGAYIQAENYIHTVEAYKDYLEHLGPDGILSIGLIKMHPPKNMLRACVLMVTAMRELEIAEPEKKIILIQQASTIQMLARKSSFTQDEVENQARQMKLYASDKPVTFEFRYLFNQRAPLYFRHQPFQQASDDAFDQYFRAVAQGTDKQFLKNYKFDVSAVRDDKPFFYKFYYWPFLSFVEGGIAGIILWAQFFESVFFALVFMLLPMAWLKRGQTTGLFRRIWFFFFIGLGFMMIEIPLIQRFVLYLGHPTYAMALVLAALLVFSGIGSALFQRYLSAKTGVVWACVAGIILLNLAGIWPLPGILKNSLALGFGLRALITAAWTACLGILMGWFFPAGIRRLEEGRPGLVPWAWAINTSASVVSSIAAVMLAMNLGFRIVSLAACLFYLAAGLSFNLLGKK